MVAFVRKPFGYVGVRHETLGTDILSVQQALTALSPNVRTANNILGAENLEYLATVKPDGWYPVDILLDLLEQLDAQLGRYGLIKIGRTLFKMTHEARLRETTRTGYEIVAGFDSMYRHANRGEQIGGWKVLRFDSTSAELEKTTPHHCAMEEGIFTQALSAVGVSAVVTQPTCFRKGAAACRFEITPVGGNEHWGGPKK